MMADDISEGAGGSCPVFPQRARCDHCGQTFTCRCKDFLDGHRSPLCVSSACLRVMCHLNVPGQGQLGLCQQLLPDTCHEGCVPACLAGHHLSSLQICTMFPIGD